MSQTKYCLSNTPAKITVNRRHHPLEGQQLEVLSGGRSTVVVRLPDGSSLKLARRWTDIDGRACRKLAGDATFTLPGLRELLELFLLLRERCRATAAESDDKIKPPHEGAGKVSMSKQRRLVFAEEEQL